MGAATVLEIEAATPPIRKLVAQSAELCVVIAWALCVGVWMCQYEVVTMYSGSLGSHAQMYSWLYALLGRGLLRRVSCLPACRAVISRRPRRRRVG